MSTRITIERIVIESNRIARRAKTVCRVLYFRNTSWVIGNKPRSPERVAIPLPLIALLALHRAHLLSLINFTLPTHTRARHVRHHSRLLSKNARDYFILVCMCESERTHTHATTTFLCEYVSSINWSISCCWCSFDDTLNINLSKVDNMLQLYANCRSFYSTWWKEYLFIYFFSRLFKTKNAEFFFYFFLTKEKNKI